MNPRLISRLFFSLSVFSMLLFSCADPRTGECSADTDCPDGERCVLQACILDDTQPIDDTDASDASSEVSDASDDSDSSDATDASDASDPSTVTDPSDLEDPSDASEADASTTVDPTPVTPELSLSLVAPAEQTVVEIGSNLTIRVYVAVNGLDESLTPELTISSQRDGQIFQGNVAPNQEISIEWTPQNAGIHTLTFSAVLPLDDTTMVANASLSVGVCGWSDAETFDGNVEGAGWSTMGTGARIVNEAGNNYLELTGRYGEYGSRGAYFDTTTQVAPGNVNLRFRVRTGGGQNTGGDGFAMSIFEVNTVEELQSIVGSAFGGSGLGYGVAGGGASGVGTHYGTLEVNAFHIEFDTWHNNYDGSQGHTDPLRDNGTGTGNHIAITTNGNPGMHYIWEEVSLEDNQWHQVEIRIQGSNVQVLWDNAVLMQDDVGGFTFKGGLLGFTASTGWATNYHSIDDLQVMESCTF